MSLRARTALFGHFGIEWDITGADREELAELAAVDRAVQAAPGARSTPGRVVRLDTPDDTAWMHGVVAADRSAALMSYVQLDEPGSDGPAALRVPGSTRRRYRVTDVTPGQRAARAAWRMPRVAGVEVSGAALGEIGLAIPPQRVLGAAVILVQGLLGAIASDLPGGHCCVG